MWRRILLCSSLCLLCCCCLVGAAMAADAPLESTEPEPETMTADQFLQELGFDTEDEEEVSLFLTWLYPLEPASEHDMALILSGSEYSTLDPCKVYFLWECLHGAYDSEEYWASSGTGGSNSVGTIGFIGFNKSNPGVIYIMQRLPNNSGDIGSVPVLAELDIGKYMAEQGYLTQASLTPLEEILRDIRTQQLQDSLRFSDLLGLIGVDNGDTVLGLLGSIRERLSIGGSSVLKYTRSWSYDSSSNSLRPAAAADDRQYGVAELLDVNFKDLDQLLLKNFGTSKGYLGSVAGIPANSGLFTYMDSFARMIDSSLFLDYHEVLNSQGDYGYDMGGSLSFVTADGFLGLSRNMEAALVGGHDGSAAYSRLTFDDALNKSTESVDYTDLLHAMVGIGSDLQNPLSQLQAVLAGDSDLELRRNTQENIDSVTDNFTGSGEGAVSSGDISDASGLTSGIGDAFGGNQVSTGDAFKAATDSGNFNFFSQETAVALDSVTYPAAVPLADDDAWMSDYVADENGFYTVADKSGWSLLDYLGKEG